MGLAPSSWVMTIACVFRQLNSRRSPSRVQFSRPPHDGRVEASFLGDKLAIQGLERPLKSRTNLDESVGWRDPIRRSSGPGQGRSESRPGRGTACTHTTRLWARSPLNSEPRTWTARRPRGAAFTSL